MKWFCFCEHSIAIHQPRSLLCNEKIPSSSSSSPLIEPQHQETTETTSAELAPSLEPSSSSDLTISLLAPIFTANEPMSTTAVVTPPLLPPLPPSARSPPPPSLIPLSDEEKDVLAKYSVHNNFQNTCEQFLKNKSDSNVVTYIINNLEVPIPDIRIINLNNFCERSVLNSLLSRKLQCDRNFSAVLTYIRGNDIHELNLMELDSILNLFTFNMFFRVCFIKCLTGSCINIKPFEKHPISNINANYKNIICLIEDMVEFAVYEANYQFLNILHSAIIELKIPFIFSTSEKENQLYEWLHNQNQY